MKDETKYLHAGYQPENSQPGVMSIAQSATYVCDSMEEAVAEMVFPIGSPNDGFAQYFIGRSFLAPLSTSQAGVFNVAFEPGMPQ